LCLHRGAAIRRAIQIYAMTNIAHAFIHRRGSSPGRR
jgi:hypothetical protein